MTLFPIKLLKHIRPVAAADYFLKNPFIAWFSEKIMGIIPIKRSTKSNIKEHPLEPIIEALNSEDIVILFPEGTRGEPEEFSEFKVGIAHLAKRFPEAPVIPIYMHGLGKALPRGEALLVPFFIDIFIGEQIKWSGEKKIFMAELNRAMETLASECPAPAWE
jgi:1-acyl-sn-glycerol-3-phosphate acyltransferase